jgi:drug/metabolite transporter (DMT)-like permease
MKILIPVFFAFILHTFAFSNDRDFEKFSMMWAQLWNFVLIGVMVTITYYLWRSKHE